MDEKMMTLCKVLRECCILLMTALDDILGYERTIPNRQERRRLKQG